MKLNLEFYKETEFNKLTAEEKDIINMFWNKDEKRIPEHIININSSYEELKAATDNRKNIISFYPIEEDATVLELGANYGEITLELCKKAKKVISIEGKKEKAEVISRRYAGIENLEIYAGELKNVKLEEKFDYVIALNEEFNSLEDVDKFLKNIKSRLKLDGKAIIALDNKFGIKYWSGIKKENDILAYETLTGKNDIVELSEFQKKLVDNNFKTKIYYPMPDITFTNAIYTDEWLPSTEHINSRFWEFVNTKLNDINFSEKEVLKELVKKDKNLFKLFVNSYLLVANNSKEDIGIKAVTYGIFRKPEYRIKTIIKTKEVVKTANNELAKKHIQRIKENIEILNKLNIKTLDKFENDSIVSEYVDNGQTLDKVLMQLFKEGRKEDAYNKIIDFKSKVLEKFPLSNSYTNSVFRKYGVECNPKEIKKLTFLKNGLYDLIFQNCFVIKNNYYAYDQEWSEQNVPLEFIIYRSILNLPEIDGVITHDELYEKFGIVKYLDIFTELENKMQNEIRDDAMWNLHVKTNQKLMENIEKQKGNLAEADVVLEKENEIKAHKEEIKNLSNVIKEKDTHIQNLENQLQVISNSFSWKIIKPFRFLAWVFNPFSGATFIDRIMPPGGRRRLKYDEKLAKKLWEEKINGYRAATDEAGVEYWKGIEHRERLKIERDVERLESGKFFSDYEYWMKENDPTQEELDAQRKFKFKKRPKISIVIPLYNTPEDFFRELLFNMYRQTYTNWELCLADGSNEKLEYIEKMCKDPRIHYKFLGENKGISGNSNEGLKMVTGDYVALLDHDDLLMPNALFEIVKVINERKNVRFIYTDEDKMKTIDEPRFDPHFKPDFSPDYITGNNYICHFSVFKKEVMDKLGGFRDEYNGAQDLDIILRMSEIVEPKDIYHIPKILYHWRISDTSTAGNPETKLYAYISGEKAVQHHIDRLNIKGVAQRDEKMYGIYKVKYDILGDPKVNIIIPNFVGRDLLKKCVDSIIENTTYSNYEIAIIDSGCADKELNEYYAELEKNKKIKVLRYKMSNPSFAKLVNYGVKNTKGQIIVQLTSTSTIIEKGWLENLLGFVQRENTGVVVGKVFSEEDRILHAGMVVAGDKGKIFLNQGIGDDVYGYFAKECHVQNFSCLGLNTMSYKRTDFEKVGGLSETLVGYEELDFCLSLRKLGLLNVYMPYSKVYDSDKEFYEIDTKNIDLIKEKWKEFFENGDMYFNKNFDTESNKYDVKKAKV